MHSALKQFDGIVLDGLEFCSRVYVLFEEIRGSPGGVSRLRKRQGAEKKLLEELLPICEYIQAHYQLGRYICVKWVDGSQTYDAELVQYGAYVQESYYPAHAYLEITSVMHRNEYLARELLETKGVAFGVSGIRRLKDRSIESVPVGYTNREHVGEFSRLLLRQVSAKEAKPYPENTILIVQCNLNTIYMRDEWDDLVAEVKRNLARSRFREIYLYDPVGRFSQLFYPSRL